MADIWSHSSQMYKKRFSKWGFYKNNTRSAANREECTKVSRRESAGLKHVRSLQASPGLITEDDRLVFMVLTGVQTWSVSFFETVQFPDGLQAPQPKVPTESQLRQFKTKEANFAFKLVVDLLDRGHGVLAGRMARKAFLLAEDMLTLEGPALLWNLLEMMHYMVTLRQAYLFKVLLGHLMALAVDLMPKAHPLIAMLRGLRQLVASLGATSSRISSSSTIPSSSASDGTKHTTVISGALPSLLKRAWTLNADILMDNFDPRLFPLYFRILWDNCSITAPPGLVDAAKKWFCHVEGVQAPSTANVGHHAVRLLASTLHEEDKMLESLLTPPDSFLERPLPMPDYEDLRARSLAEVKARGQSYFADESTDRADSRLSLAMLAVLATAKVIEGSLPARGIAQAGHSAITNVSSFDAGRVACIIRTLIELDVEQHGVQNLQPADVVERVRAVVTLRAYAEGETDPQVVREMWLLQDALDAAGRQAEAREVGREAYRRIEMYCGEIPVDSA